LSRFEISARVLNRGTACAQAMVLDEALSFWGGFDAQTGIIVDQHHPQKGRCIAGRFLVMPESRGSAGTPAGIAEAIRRGVGPAAIALGKADVNVAVGAMVAAALYGMEIPVLVIGHEDRARLRSGDRIEADLDGRLQVVQEKGSGTRVSAAAV
jgi:predicted aconitase with swiveling domain